VIILVADRKLPAIVEKIVGKTIHYEREALENALEEKNRIERYRQYMQTILVDVQQ